LGQNNDHPPLVSTRFILEKLLAMIKIQKTNVQEVRNPKSIEQIASPSFLLSMVLPEIKEFEDISVPCLNVDGKRPRTLVASLINITCGGVICTQHRYNTIRVTVGTSDV
jgi:hypothetical protein